MSCPTLSKTKARFGLPDTDRINKTLFGLHRRILFRRAFWKGMRVKYIPSLGDAAYAVSYLPSKKTPSRNLLGKTPFGMIAGTSWWTNHAILADTSATNEEFPETDKEFEVSQDVFDAARYGVKKPRYTVLVYHPATVETPVVVCKNSPRERYYFRADFFDVGCTLFPEATIKLSKSRKHAVWMLNGSAVFSILSLDMPKIFGVLYKQIEDMRCDLWV